MIGLQMSGLLKDGGVVDEKEFNKLGGDYRKMNVFVVPNTQHEEIYNILKRAISGVEKTGGYKKALILKRNSFGYEEDQVEVPIPLLENFPVEDVEVTSSDFQGIGVPRGILIADLMAKGYLIRKSNARAEKVLTWHSKISDKDQMEKDFFTSVFTAANRKDPERIR